MEPGEQCDDGNLIDNDGWDQTWNTESNSTTNNTDSNSTTDNTDSNSTTNNTDSNSQQITIEPTETDETIGTGFQAVLGAGVFGSFLLSILMNVPLDGLWSLINMLQVLHHIPMFTLYFPKNILSLFQFVGLVNLENPYFHDAYLYHINENKITSKEALDYRFRNQGYESTSILLNWSDLFFFLVLLVIYYIIIILLSWILRPQQQSDSESYKCKWKMSRFIWNERRNLWLNSIIRIMLEIYLECGFSSLLNVYDFRYKTYIDIYSSTVAILWLLLIISFYLFVIICCISCHKNYTPYLNNENVEGPVKELFKNLTMKRCSSLYFTVFLTRRTILMLLVVFWRNYGYIQLPVFSWVCIFQCIFILWVRPYRNCLTNAQELVNEFIWTSILLLFFFFIDDSTELDTSGRAYLVGWAWIGLFISSVLIHFAIYTADIFKNLWKSRNKIISQRSDNFKIKTQPQKVTITRQVTESVLPGKFCLH